MGGGERTALIIFLNPPQHMEWMGSGSRWARGVDGDDAGRWKGASGWGGARGQH